MSFDLSDPNTKETVVSCGGRWAWICGTGQGLSLFMDSVSREVGGKSQQGKKQVDCSLLDFLKAEVCLRLECPVILHLFCEERSHSGLGFLSL